MVSPSATLHTNKIDVLTHIHVSILFNTFGIATVNNVHMYNLPTISLPVSSHYPSCSLAHHLRIPTLERALAMVLSLPSDQQDVILARLKNRPTPPTT